MCARKVSTRSARITPFVWCRGMQQHGTVRDAVVQRAVRMPLWHL